MQTWTIDEMMAYRPCSRYPRERLVELWAGRERLSVLDIAALDIPIEDRIWALLTAGPHVKPAVERFVERAIRTVYEKYDDPEWRAWADKWLNGEDRSQKSAESATAWAATAWAATARAAEWARAAAEWAAAEWAESAESAASAAEMARAAELAESAARAAAEWAAAAESAESAEWARAARAARAAERERQLADIVEIAQQID